MSKAGVPGLEPRLTGPEPVGLPITPYPKGNARPSGPRRSSLPNPGGSSQRDDLLRLSHPVVWLELLQRGRLERTGDSRLPAGRPPLAAAENSAEVALPHLLGVTHLVQNAGVG